MITPAPHNPNPQPPTPNPRFRGGFTLLEILIVIAIILLLLGIGVYALPRVLGTSDRAVTDSILGQLDAINVEYKALTGAYIDIKPTNNTWTYYSNTQDGNNAPGSINNNLAITTESDYAARSIERFIATAYKPGQKDAFTTMFGQLPDDFLVDAGVTLLDPVDDEQDAEKSYDTDPSAPNFVNDDGLGFLEMTDGWDNRIVYRQVGAVNADFLPKRNVPYFASAGPDGKFGDVRQTNKDLAEHQATLDNIYSFQNPAQ